MCQRPHHREWLTQFVDGRSNFLSSVCQTRSEKVLQQSDCYICTPYQTSIFYCIGIYPDFALAGPLTLGVIDCKTQTQNNRKCFPLPLIWTKSGQRTPIPNNIMTESHNLIRSQLAARKSQRSLSEELINKLNITHKLCQVWSWKAWLKYN